MPEVRGAFSRAEPADRGGEEVTDRLEGAGARRAKEGLQFREGVFDWIEVRAVRRQKLERGPDLFDGRLDGGLLVDGEIIHDDDVAGPQRRDQDLFDVGEKARLVDRPVEDAGRGEAVQAQGGEDRMRLPVPERRAIDEARAPRTPSVEPQEIGRHAAFIEKHVARRVNRRDQCAPGDSGGDDIGPPLFRRANAFF